MDSALCSAEIRSTPLAGARSAQDDRSWEDLLALGGRLRDKCMQPADRYVLAQELSARSIMSTRHTAVVTLDTIRWVGDPPAELSEGKEMRVDVVVRAARRLPESGMAGKEFVRLMDQIADAGAFGGIEDPAAWVREQRRMDRSGGHS